ncbi:hypothetical protein GCM10009801_72990 [Streptomyces albiaxialis]|uniref:Integral membrane protein n=1 Tax=Streptomyces albiaxialis TaxID=329523 RepID=A0ABP5IH88_9ACTN
MTPRLLPRRLRTARPARRRLLVLGLLLLVLSGTFLLVPQVVTPAQANPCDSLPGGKDSPAYETCMGDKLPEKDKNKKPKPPSIDDPAGLRPECKSAPVPGRPGRGAGSWALREPGKAPAPLSPGSKGASAHLYEQYGLAGMQWHTYDLACDTAGDSLKNIHADYQTQLANWLFGASRWWTSLAIGMQEEATGKGYISKIYDLSGDATKQVRDAVYAPWIGLSVVVLGLSILYRAHRKDMAATTRAIGWALLVMATASVAFNYPKAVGSMADTAIVETVGQLQQGVAGDVTRGSEPGVAQGNLLTKGVLYEGWLRGNFGDSDSKVARKYGMKLYDAQSLTWAESRLPDDERNKIIEAKQKKWEDIASKVKKEDSDAYQYLTGQADGRLSTALETGLGATPANAYSFAASTLIISARLIIPTALVFFPAIAVIALHRLMSGTLRSLGSSVAAALINAPVFALGAAMEVLFVKTFFSNNAFPDWFAVVLLWILTVMMWMITKPMRRLAAVVSPNSSWFQAGIGAPRAAKAALGGAALGYAKGRMSARQIGRMVNGKGKKGKGDEGPEDHDSTLSDDLTADGDQERHGRGPDFNDLVSARARNGDAPEHDDGGYRWSDQDWWDDYNGQSTPATYTPDRTGTAAGSDTTTPDTDRPTVPEQPTAGAAARPSATAVADADDAPAARASSAPPPPRPFHDALGRAMARDRAHGIAPPNIPDPTSTPTTGAEGSPPPVVGEASSRAAERRQAAQEDMPDPAAPSAVPGPVSTPGTGSRPSSTPPQEPPASPPPPRAPHEGDRPAPFVAPTIEEDGGQVFVVYSPTSTSGYDTHRAEPPQPGTSTPERDEDGGA